VTRNAASADRHPVLPPLPSIKAAPFVRVRAARVVELLTPDEQRELAELSTLVRLRRHGMLHPEGGHAEAVFNLVRGVAQTYHLSPSGERRVTSFLFPGDLCGLSENGYYVNTAQAVTNLIAYRIPLRALRNIVSRDPALDAHLLCKLCHDLRAAERHTVMATRRDARRRLAAFLLRMQSDGADGADDVDEGGGGGDVIRLPMLRHDIADYLGLTVESVSRAFQALEDDGVVRRRSPKLIRIMNPDALRRATEEE